MKESSFHPILDLDIRHVFKVFDIVSHVDQNDDSRAMSSSVRLALSHLRSAGSAICAQVPHRSYADGHVPALLVQPSVLPATDGLSGLGRSACEELLQVKVLCSYLN